MHNREFNKIWIKFEKKTLNSLKNNALYINKKPRFFP